MAIHMKEPPPPGDWFPSLREHVKKDKDVDDAAIFRQVSASLMPYAGKS